MNRSEYIRLRWFMVFLLTVCMTGCNGGDSVFGGGGRGRAPTTKAITNFSLNGISGVISEGTIPKTISVIMPFGTNLATAMIASYTTTGASVSVGNPAVVQVNGITANVFTQGTPTVYTVTAADDSTASYNVNVTVATASAKALISYSLDGIAGVISEATVPKTISVVMPYGTDLTVSRTATYLTTGVHVKVAGVTQTSGITTNIFTQGAPTVYTVAASDASTAAYNVNVTVATRSAKAITSYSLDGIAGVINEATTPKTISVVMPYGTDLTIPRTATYLTTGGSVAVAGAAQTSGATTNIFTQGTPKVYTVTANDATTAAYNVNVSVATSAAKAMTSYSLNGIAGVISEAITPKTITVIMPFGTDLTLPLTASYLTTGTGVAVAGGAQTSGITTNVFTQGTPKVYTVIANDSTTASYNVNVSVATSSAKAMTSYSLNGIAGVISEATTPKTITVIMPFGTDLTLPLTASYLTTGTGVAVAGGAQTSGITTNVFTQGTPKVYTVIANDSTTASYNVNVSVATSAAKAMTSYSLNGIAGVISEATTPKTITVIMPFGTDLTLPLTATYLTTGTGVAVAGGAQTSGITTNVFTQGTPKVYTVTANDSTTASYNVNVSVATNTARAITSFSLNGIAGVISEATTPKTISVSMPTGTDLTLPLTATFTTTGAKVEVGTPAVLQVSGTTPTNVFTQGTPKAYTVTAADGVSTAVYNVNVAVALNAGKAITSYSLNGIAGVISEATAPKTVTVVMPFGTDLTLPLTATFLTTGTKVEVGAPPVLQVSGTTPTNVFTQGTPKVYTVTAANNTTAAYNVNVSVAPSSAKAITRYSLNGVAGTINETAKTISVSMPSGTVKTSLTATFTITGTSATVGTPAVTQVSGTTANNFTSPVVYTVNAADGSSVTYSVSVLLGPVLGTVAPFGIAATAGVTNTATAPNTTINGDAVLDPLAGAICNTVAVDAAGGFGLCGGFAPTINGVVISPLFNLGITSSAIKADLLAAYNNLSSPPQALATNLPAGTTLGDLTGTTVLNKSLFYPGVYQSLTSIMITNDLTLDAQGNPDAIFIFQSASTIGTTAGAAAPGVHTRILLINGAKASNVWWQAGSAATLGLYSEFQGNILAHDNITLGTGATSCGRLLAGAFAAGAFVFDANVVSVPGNASAPASCQ